MGEVAELSSVLEEEAAQCTFKGGQLVGRGLAVGGGWGRVLSGGVKVLGPWEDVLGEL